MLSLVLVVLSLFDERRLEAARAAASIELNHRVIEAFERGPVVLEVTVTNRGENPVVVACPASFTHLVLKSFPKAWNLQSRIPCAGVGPQNLSLEPGQVHRERIALHDKYVSDFPAGTYQIGLSWPLTSDNPIHVLQYPEKRIPITIVPATPANRWALRARLEAEFATLPPPADRDGHSFRIARDPDPFSELCEKVASTPHKELIPLALKLIDRCPRDRTWGSIVSRDLVGTVFFADTARAHRIFVDRVIARSPHIYLTDVFSMWDLPRESLSAVGQGYLERLADAVYWRSPRLWPLLSPHEPLKELLSYSTEYTSLILPADELQRLKSTKDFWVRGWMYATFSDRLGPKWCDEFLDEAQKWARIAPGPVAVELAYDDRCLLIHLWHRDSSTRKLLEILAAGNQDNPVCKEARKLLAELQEERIKR